MTPRELVEACRVTGLVEPAVRGSWSIIRVKFPDFMGPKAAAHYGLELGEDYTALRRLAPVDSSQPWQNLAGETVMEDSRRELRRHLPILIPARGRVLVSGLGLGCVVRGLLAKPEVTRVDVIERDPTIIELVLPSLARHFGGRLRIHPFDALTMEWPASARWDFAWHDIWCEGSGLDLLHAELILRYRSRVRRQGAWQLPRWTRRLLRRGDAGLLEGRPLPLLEDREPREDRRPLGAFAPGHGLELSEGRRTLRV